MSDSESILAAAPPHPHLGGKSLQSLERPRYKSWRKKYRKMRHHFDATLEENKRLFKEEQKLDHIAKRLREELDGLLELCLDLNGTPALPADLRFNLSYPSRPECAPSVVAPDITPEAANVLVENYTKAVQAGTIQFVDLHIVREQALERLAAQDVETLLALQNAVSQPIPSAEDLTAVGTEDGEDAVPAPVSYFTQEQEDEYLERLDEKLAVAEGQPPKLHAAKEKDVDGALKDGKNMADLTPRELERQMELNNPQSQHNWLKTHTKVLTNLGGGDDDGDSVAGLDGPAKSAGSKRRTGKDQKTLAKQVGDRAVERAREGWSPGAGSTGGAMEEDEMGLEDGLAGGGRKKTRDADGTYRLKGSKPSAGGGSKAKRKRSGEDLGLGGAKKARVEGE